MTRCTVEPFYEHVRKSGDFYLGHKGSLKGKGVILAGSLIKRNSKDRKEPEGHSKKWISIRRDQKV